jgi:hypothetical protein
LCRRDPPTAIRSQDGDGCQDLSIFGLVPTIEGASIAGIANRLTGDLELDAVTLVD